MQSRSKVTRREFLGRMTQAGLSLGALALGNRSWAAQPSPPRNLRIGTGTKAVLRASDFSYLGSFKLPQASGGKSTDWSRALTHRYVNGQLRFFTSTDQAPSYTPGEVYEVTYPGCATSNYPTATVAQHWGDIYGDKLVDESNKGGTLYVYGLFWDSIGQRLYWNYGNDYNTSASNNPCLGVTTLNDSTGKATPVAAYRMGDCKMFQYGITAIPSWFASAYTGGRRLGVGFGGRASAESLGPSSDGPVLAAIDPPTGAHLSELPSTTLCSYPCDPTNGDPYYCRRPGDYMDGITAAGHPRGPFNNGAYGGWQWMDFIYQSGMWIDMPTKHGFMILPVLGHGNIWYESSTIHSDDLKHWFFVFDPMDLAAVAQATKNPWAVIPASYWEVQYALYGYPMGRCDGEPFATPQGATFDATNNRIYVLLPWTNGNYPMISVFQVS